MTKTTNRLRIIVLGAIVRWPLGGIAWHHLQYAMGLAQLNHDVFFLEDSGDNDWCCYDPVRDVSGVDPNYGLTFAKQVFQRVGLDERWAYYDAHTSRWLGPLSNRVNEICNTAELVINLSGANPIRPWFSQVPIIALVDTDPGFTQIGRIIDPVAKAFALQHTVFFSFGENIPFGRSTVPDDGFPWQATRQPIVLDAWPVSEGPTKGKFTTVMSWDSHAGVEYNGCHYGMKGESFGPYMCLPQNVGHILELALGSRNAPRTELVEKGWSVCNPLKVTRNPWTYQDYIQKSKAEFGIAKHGFVISRCGWFSERSAAYLASGRPVIVQETGFSDWLETGRGVVAFRTPEEAINGIQEINLNYTSNCRAARDVAEEYFDSNKVLSSLVEHAMHPPRVNKVEKTK
jgi:hypothetical protein